jgi:hypothetical protein
VNHRLATSDKVKGKAQQNNQFSDSLKNHDALEITKMLSGILTPVKVVQLFANWKFGGTS